jgi:hypothetical protein
MTIDGRFGFGVVGGLGAIAGADLLQRLIRTIETGPEHERYAIVFEQQSFPGDTRRADERYDPTARKLHAFSLWNFIMWGIMVWIYVWLIQMLWRLDPSAWLFLAVITTFNLILDFMVMLGNDTTFSAVSLSFLLNAIILIYCMLPSTKRAFGQK